MFKDNLLDENLYKIISKCFINKRSQDTSEIFVVYEDGAREPIWSFNSNRYEFTHREFIGKTKIESVFYCDRKKPKSITLL